MNGSPLLARPPTVTATLPVVAPAGTGTTMLVADQLVGVALVPLNVTELIPFVAPKLVPAIVTDVPTGALAGVSDVSVGAAATVYVSPLLAKLLSPTATTTFPVVAPAGTGTTMLVADQPVGVALFPLNLTVLVPLLAPKFVPPMATDVPTGPIAGVSEVRIGKHADRERQRIARSATDRDDDASRQGSDRHRDDDAGGRPVRRRRTNAIELDCARPLRCAKIGPGDRHRHADRAARRREAGQSRGGRRVKEDFR